MTTTSSIRMTAGTLLGTVNEAATTVADTFSTVTKAVGMANTYVSTMAHKQQVRTKLELSEYTTRLIEESAMTAAVRQKGVLEFCKDETQGKLYEAAHNKFVDILSK